MIAVDTTSSAQVAGNTVLSWSHTCTGTDLALLVVVHAGLGITGVSCTYNGVSMTKIWELSSTGVITILGWLLAAPATGAHTITATMSGSTDYQGEAISFTGVDQSTTKRTPVIQDSAFVNLSDAISGDYVVDGITYYANDTLSVAGGRTAWFLDNTALFGNNLHRGASYLAASGSTTMTWTDAGTLWVQGGVALIPSGPPPPPAYAPQSMFDECLVTKGWW